MRIEEKLAEFLTGLGESREIMEDPAELQTGMHEFRRAAGSQPDSREKPAFPASLLRGSARSPASPRG